MDQTKTDKDTLRLHIDVVPPGALQGKVHIELEIPGVNVSAEHQRALLDLADDRLDWFERNAPRLGQVAESLMTSITQGIYQGRKKCLPLWKRILA